MRKIKTTIVTGYDEHDKPIFERISGFFLTQEEFYKVQAKLTICPLCEEKYKLTSASKKFIRSERITQAVDLFEAKYTYREIATKLGYKSPRSVQVIIEDHLKAKKSTGR
jgi:AraC-like DNA-binding protein